MSDFYALLKQSILERGIVDTGERDRIYAQARRAMIRRLWEFDPPLDEDEIEQRINAFDVAMSDIEADVVAAFSEPAYEDEFAGGDGYGRPGREPVGYRRGARRLPAALPPPREPDYGGSRGGGLVPYREPPPRRSYLPAPQTAPYDDRWPDEPPPARGREPGRRGRQPPPPDPYDEPEVDEEAAVEQRRVDRWSGPRPRRRPKPPPKRGFLRLSDADKIRLLAGAIGLFAVILAGAGVALLAPRDDGGVTVDIGSRREVSDAATAVRVAAQDMNVDQTFMLFDGRDPTVFETSPDNPIRFDANAGVVRVSSSSGSPGVKALIGPGLATRLAGHDVRVTIVARSSREGGAASMRFAYQSGVAISYWQTATLSPDFQAVAMVWRVPALRTDRAGDLLVIQPGIPGDGTGADIKSIKIDLLPGQG